MTISKGLVRIGEHGMGKGLREDWGHILSCFISLSFFNLILFHQECPPLTYSPSIAKPIAKQAIGLFKRNWNPLTIFDRLGCVMLFYVSG